MPLTRDSMQSLIEIVDEAKQRVQEARTAVDEETRQKKLELAEKSIRQIESLMAGGEG